MWESIKAAVNRVFLMVTEYIPTVVGAIIVFIVGWLLASLIRKISVIFMKKVRLDERIAEKSGSENPMKVEGLISNLIFYILMIYVLLLSLDVLGVEGVLNPILNMLDSFLFVVPNIFAALLIGIFGYILAKMLSGTVNVLVQGLDKYNTKVGLSEKFAFSKLLSQLTFLFVFIPVLIAALEALKIEAISVPAENMLSELIGAVPNIIAAAVIIAVAYIAGRFVKNMFTDLISNLGADAIPEKVGAKSVFGKLSFSKLCGNILFFFIMLGASVSAVEKLAMPKITDILSNLLIFSGNIALGLIILAIGNFLANIAYKTLHKASGGVFIPMLVKVSIIGLVLAMGLNAMGVAEDIVQMAFALTLGSIALTFALAFGLGGREAAGKQMEYWLAKLRGDDKK